jgi:hypothetical protein
LIDIGPLIAQDWRGPSRAYTGPSRACGPAGLRAHGLRAQGLQVSISLGIFDKVITLDHFEHISPGETLGSLWS